jgi:hypothetical protein
MAKTPGFGLVDMFSFCSQGVKGANHRLEGFSGQAAGTMAQPISGCRMRRRGTKAISAA